MTSPIAGNDAFGILTVQYTYRFIGKSRAGEGARFDMSKLEDVKKAYIENSKQHQRLQSQSAASFEP